MSVTLSDLEKRFASIPTALDETLRAKLTLDDFALKPSDGFDVVGVGASEMPARLLVNVLAAAGMRTRFVPISRFSGEGPPDDLASKQILVVFSQGLSPNARIALSHSEQYRRALLITAIAPDEPSDRGDALRTFGGLTLRHLPSEEGGSLVRLAGPLCAAFLSLRLALLIIERAGLSTPQWSSDLLRVPERYCERARTKNLAIDGDPLACISLGHELDYASNLMWKWQEATYTPAPLAVDVLAFAHGPLQSLYEKEGLLLFLQAAECGVDELLERLRRSVHPKRHRIVSLRSELPWPLSLFEYDAQLTGLVLEEACRRQLDPSHWPGKEHDEPLYSLTLPLRNDR